MQRGQFELIAKELNYRYLLVLERSKGKRSEAVLEIENLINQFSDTLQETYPNFKREMFLNDCFKK